MSTASAEASIAQLLTVVITTSPTLSAPSTALLSSVLASFQTHCPQLLGCRVVVVLDTYEAITAHPRLKKGQVTQDGADNYRIYVANAKTLFLQEWPRAPEAEEPELQQLTETHGEAEYGSAINPPVPLRITATDDGGITFIEAQGRRLGFGLAVRTALRALATPYVWVHQHDWALISPVPVEAILRVMQAADADVEKPVRYVCLPSGRRTLYATSDKVTPFPQLRQLASTLTGEYTAPGDGGGGGGGGGGVAVSLTPMFFWHDKPHIASRAHYLQRVFPSRLAMLRGAFIEDTIGQKARGQMKQGLWAKWATWLYNPGGGKQICLKHLHGRTWRGDQEEQRMRNMYREQNMAAPP